MSVTGSNTQPIALALSGGGIRAMVFHLGVLRRLAERGLLEKVDMVSTVSGGSLLVGLLLQQNNLQWPSSEVFRAQTWPALRDQLCARSLQWGTGRQLLNPLNWKYLLSRSNLLALALRNEWGITATLAGLPKVPEWSINGTTAENGKRFRFKRHDMGDYSLGYASGNDFPLASALAVSAAFPGGFGPLTLAAQVYEWRKRPWDSPAGTEQPIGIRYDRLHLYDGGVYDNLGLEPFFDTGRQKAKHDGHYIVASDAGAPLAPGFDHGPLSVFRLKRVADIMSDQSRALRVRSFVAYLQQNPANGAYLYINSPVIVDRKSAAKAAEFPTTLHRLRPADFAHIEQHGYAVTMGVEQEFGLYENTAVPKRSIEGVPSLKF
jgi:NTE family protein